MNIKQIETFVRIVELGSFSAAAEALYASQSTISARIKELERYLGVELFDRHHHRPQLTPKGHELFDFAQQLVEFTSSLTRTMRDPSAITGTLRKGVVGVVANTWLPALVSRLREKHPRLGVKLDVGLTRLLMERLRDGHLDLAIVAGSVSDPELLAELLGYDEFVWMAGPSLPVPHGRLGPSDLKELPVLMLSEESHHYPIVRQWFRDAGVMHRPAASCNNMSVLAELTRQGLGVSLLPRQCYGPELAEGRLVVLETHPQIPRVPFSLVYRADRVPVMVPAIVETAKAASDLSHA